eukprot:2098028-Pyramimonas_sp.AAC.1
MALPTDGGLLRPNAHRLECFQDAAEDGEGRGTYKWRLQGVLSMLGHRSSGDGGKPCVHVRSH